MPGMLSVCLGCDMPSSWDSNVDYVQDVKQQGSGISQASDAAGLCTLCMEECIRT